MPHRMTPLTPSMLQILRYMREEKHSDAWYKYQVYAPHDMGSDDLGYVHFESKKEMDKFVSAMSKK